MKLEVSQIIDLLAHGSLIISLVYILQEVIPNSKLLNKIYPPFSIATFRALIGLTILVCFFDAIDKREAGVSEMAFNLLISIISIFVCYYSPVLERILEQNFEERVEAKKPIPERIKEFFKKKHTQHT